MELKDYLRILRRRWLVIILLFGGFLGVAQLYVTKQVRMYYATSEVIVKESPYPLYSEMFPALFQDYFTRATRIAMIKSRVVLRPAVLALDKYYPDVRTGGAIDDDKVNSYVAAIAQWINTAEDKDNSIVRINFYDPNPRKAVDVANAIAMAFYEFSSQLTKRGINEAVAQIDRIVTERDKQIKDVEKDVYKLPPKREKLATTMDLALKQAIAAIENLRQAQSKNDSDIETLGEDIDIITKSLKEGRAPSSTFVSLATPKAESIIDSINQTETALQKLRQKYTNEYPQVKQMEARLVELKKSQADYEEKEFREQELTNEFAAMKRLADMRTQKQSLIDKKAKLARQIPEAEKYFKELNEKWQSGATPEDAKELKIEAERIALEGKLGFYSDSRRSAEETKLKLLANENLIQSPVEKPTHILKYPQDVQLFATATTKSLPMNILLATIIGVATAFLLEYLNTTVRTEQDVRRYVNLPIMGTVLKIKDEGQRLLMNLAPKSPLSEVFNTIGTMVQTYSMENKAKTFMVASSKAGEGKSTVLANIAVALARSGERVLVLDCDLRKAVMHKFFNVQNEKGVSNYLMSQIKLQEEGGATKATKATKIPATHITRYEEDIPTEPILLDEIIKPTEVEGLTLVPAGPHPKNPVGLLKSDAFKELLSDVKEKANIVLVDVPPVNIAVDTMVLSSMLDGIVLLVSAGETNKDEVSYAKRLIESAKGKMFGCILNKVTIESRGYYYYYYYYYYYDSAKYYREV